MKRTLTQMIVAKTLICSTCKNLKRSTYLLLGFYLMINLNQAKAQNEESTCDLPVDIGNCDESISRYYYSAETGNCQPFYYSGCAGNSNNYESYIACADACSRSTKCPEGDPLEWDWIQKIISEGSLCGNGSIWQFEYNGNTYFRVGIASQCNISDYCRYFYDCKGDFVCLSCDLSPPEYEGKCDDNFFRYTSDVTTIWNFEPNCNNPLEKNYVKLSIQEGCTEAIYTFDYDDEQYLYFKNACNYYDELVNCNFEGFMCTAIETRRGFPCSSLINSILPFVNAENLIWTNPNEYAYTGTVAESNCGLYIDAGSDGLFEPLIILEDFYYRGGVYEGQVLQSGLNVEFSYTALPDSTSCPTNGTPVEITSIRVIDEICGCDIRDDLPICGADGKTYQNPCFADCAGVELAYDSPCEVCYDEDPLQAEWIRALIIDDDYSCRLSEIRQFEYDDEAHFMVLSDLDCLPRDRERYYNCYGDYINNQAIQAAAESATTIWTFDNNPCSNLLELDFVQSWISDPCTESIYQVEFEGNTFLYVNSGSSCYYENYGRSLYEERNIYHCNSGIDLNRLDLVGYEAWDTNQAIHYTLLTEENIIWTRPCTYESKGVVKTKSDSECDLVIESEYGNRLYPGILATDFILRENQAIEFTYRTLSDRFECSSYNVEIICIREGCVDNEISICAPVSAPPPLDLAYFINDDNLSSSPSLQVETQIDVQKYFTTTTYNYTISDNIGNQRTCATKYHIANQFLQAPDVTSPSVICQEDLWSNVKIAGEDQYQIYADTVRRYRELSTCQPNGLVCSTTDLGVDTSIPGRRNFVATSYFEFPDGTLCESEAKPFHLEVQPNPVARLSMQNKTININEGIALMDLVTINKSGYWSGKNVIYVMTESGENIAFFLSSAPGAYKLYYTVRNDFCERSYLLIVEVASAGKTALSDLPYKTTNTSFNMYPNPTTKNVFIDLPDETVYQINLTDISGKVVKQLETKMDERIAEINVKDIPKGVYFVALKNALHHKIRKLIVE